MHLAHRAPQARAVQAGGLEQLARDLEEERTHHPHRDRQIHRRVQDDQRPDVVEQADVVDDHVQRHDRRDDWQHLGADEEEQHVLGLLDRPKRQRERSRNTRVAATRMSTPPWRTAEFASVVPSPESRTARNCVECRGEEELRRVGVGVDLLLERGEHHPEDREEEPETGDPGDDRPGTELTVLLRFLHRHRARWRAVWWLRALITLPPRCR